MNRLASESSLYLRQHASNPVNWVPWSAAAWAQARAESRPVIVSIGYSACHWCHVMERESFEDTDIAGFMNRRFICIKVDREERPDVDRVYMEAIAQLTGMSGWPLNAICLPDGRPFAGGTYFPPRRWLALLLSVVKSHQVGFEWEGMWDEDAGSASSECEGVRDQVKAPPSPPQPSTLNPVPSTLNPQSQTAIAAAMEVWDTVHGGIVGAPKFPMPPHWRLVVQEARCTADPNLRSALLDQVRRTLDGMLRGGLHDRVGGGFCRYAVDEAWRFPHFEKMLVDQACVLDLIARAAAAEEPESDLWEEWQRAAAGTVRCVLETFSDPAGGFKLSIDADTPAGEGAFYTWTVEELRAALPDRGTWAAVMDCCGVGREGAMEDGRSVLLEVRGVSADERHWLDAAYTQLRVWREAHREAPVVDPKVVSGATALMASALVTAGGVFREPEWVARAEEAMWFVLREMRGAGKLKHVRGVDGAAFLDDVAYAAAACLDLYGATFREEWREAAVELTEEGRAGFIDRAGRRVRYASAATEAPAFAEAPVQSDGTVPSAAAVLVEVGAALGYPWASEVLRWQGPVDPGEVLVEGRWTEVRRWAAAGLTCRVDAGEGAAALRAGMRAAALPGLRLEPGEVPEGTAIVCGAGSCDAPASRIEDVVEAWRRRAILRA